MTLRSRIIWRALFFLATSLVGFQAFGGPPRVQSQHPTRMVPEGRGAYFELREHEMLAVEIEGPIHLGFRLRAILGDTPPGPIDLTMIRDDKEQATVQFSLPEGGKGEVSGEVLVKVVVPAGRHAYRLLASGAERGFAIQPMSGAIRSSKNIIVATPGSPPVAPPESPSPEPKQRIPQAKPRPLVVPEASVLEPVPLGVLVEGKASITAITSTGDSVLRLGPWSRTGFVATGALLMASTGLLLAARVDSARGVAEPVQIEAARYFERADNTQVAGAVLFAITGAVAAASVTALFLENP